MISTILEVAKYFIVEDSSPKEWHHYALNFECYTHFTSPIRRYPDVLVHRLLSLAITHDKQMIKFANKKEMISIMEKCNDDKQMSRRVNRDCE